MHVSSHVARILTSDPHMWRQSPQGYANCERCFLVKDLKDHGVGVTAIFPAYVESSMTEDASFPSDKMIRPEDIAQAALLPFRMSRFAVPSEIVVRNAVRA